MGPPRAGLGALALVMVCLLCGCSPAVGEKKEKDSDVRNLPNVVFILADDLDAGSVSRMPNLRSLLIEQGTTFENAFATNPLCCPSRATILRGQYAHNHEILGNEPPQGGSEKFHEMGHENSTMATWLDEEDYRTVFIGKYLNGYGFGEFDSEYVPRGWDRWYGIAGNYLSNRVNENGEIKNYDPGTHNSTDVLSGKAAGYVRRAAGEDASLLANDEPFFMWLGTKAPHEPATPAPRHEDAFANAPLPRSPSFNEKDVSDKPGWVRDNPPLNAEQVSEMQELYRNRLESMLAVDEMIGRLVGELREAGELDDTYIVFTSDNGFHMGEHRLGWGKWTAYEEDIRVPLVVRGPGVPAGRKLDHMVLNNDLAPTFAELAEAETPPFVDGRSLAPLLTNNPPPPRRWRQAFLVEGIFETAGDLESPESLLTGDPPPEDWRRQILLEGAGANRDWGRPGFEAIRTKDHLYVEYETGGRELYDLGKDPYQLNNTYPAADPQLLQSLEKRLDALRSCYGSFCGTAENGAPEEDVGRESPMTSSSGSGTLDGEKTIVKRR